MHSRLSFFVACIKIDNGRGEGAEKIKIRMKRATELSEIDTNTMRYKNNDKRKKREESYPSIFCGGR